jgi:hypothetical protein
MTRALDDEVRTTRFTDALGGALEDIQCSSRYMRNDIAGFDLIEVSDAFVKSFQFPTQSSQDLI